MEMVGGGGIILGGCVDDGVPIFDLVGIGFEVEEDLWGLGICALFLEGGKRPPRIGEGPLEDLEI